MRVAVLGCVVAIGGCAASTDATGGSSGTDLASIAPDALHMVVVAPGPLAGNVQVRLGVSGPPCPMLPSAGGSFGGAALSLVNAGGQQAAVPGMPARCNDVVLDHYFPTGAGSGDLPTSVVEIHDDSHTVSATFPASLFVSRTMSASVARAAQGDVVLLQWSPASDLSSGMMASAEFSIGPSCAPGAEGCPPPVEWQAPVTNDGAELSLVVPAPGQAHGVGGLTVSWSPSVSGVATSCDVSDCQFTMSLSAVVPFTTLP